MYVDEGGLGLDAVVVVVQTNGPPDLYKQRTTGGQTARLIPRSIDRSIDRPKLRLVHIQSSGEFRKDIKRKKTREKAKLAVLEKEKGRRMFLEG